MREIDWDEYRDLVEWREDRRHPERSTDLGTPEERAMLTVAGWHVMPTTAIPHYWHIPGAGVTLEPAGEPGWLLGTALDNWVGTLPELLTYAHTRFGL